MNESKRLRVRHIEWTRMVELKEPLKLTGHYEDPLSNLPKGTLLIMLPLPVGIEQSEETIEEREPEEKVDHGLKRALVMDSSLKEEVKEEVKKQLGTVLETRVAVLVQEQLIRWWGTPKNHPLKAEPLERSGK